MLLIFVICLTYSTFTDTTKANLKGYLQPHHSISNKRKCLYV